MGIFTRFGNIWAQSNAAIVAENMLLLSEPDLDRAVSKEFSKICINKAWEIYPDVFNGRYGQRPHKIITALVGMAQVLNSTERNHSYFKLLLLATSKLFQEIEKNRSLYPFKSIDYKMIEIITPIIEDEMLALDEKYQEISQKINKMKERYQIN